MGPDTSSSLDDPRERAEHIDANHMTMTKFSGRNDPGYRKVGEEIRLLVKAIRKKELERPDNDNG